MIAYVIALKSELKYFFPHIETESTEFIAGKEVIKCSLFGKKSIIIISGIGKVNASFSTQIVIDKFSPNIIVNFGAAGGCDKDVKVLSYYIAEKCCQYDFEQSLTENLPLGFIQGYDSNYFNAMAVKSELEKKIFGTADKFLTEKDDLSPVKNLKVSVCDMECGAIAETCVANGVPFISVKGITDSVYKENGTGQFVENLDKIAKGFPAIIEKIVKNAL